MARTEREKLVRLGLRSPVETGNVADSTITTLQNNIAEEWATFQEKFQDANLSSFGEFETWLEDNGIAAERAASIRNQIQPNFKDFSAFKTAVIDEYKSWDDFRSAFGSTTEFSSDSETVDGNPAAGIRVFEESGTTKDGVEVPQGSTEVFGKEVHFSQEEAEVKPDKGNDPSVDTDIENPIEYLDTLVEDSDNNDIRGQEHPTDEFFEFRTDITNNTNYDRTIQADRIIDGQVYVSFEVTVEANSTRTVVQQITSMQSVADNFDGVADAQGTHSFTFNKAKPGEVEFVAPDI